MINISLVDDNSRNKHSFNTKTLIPKENLYSKFWKKGRDGGLNPIVSRKLMQIADDIIKSLKLSAEPKDIIITGSIASYNWHEMSDIDLHILYDFYEINQDYELVNKMFNQTRINWNKTHNITISGKEVELYFQHAYEPHEANGIWSLELEKWLAQPVNLDPKVDIQSAHKKAAAISSSIDHLYDLFKIKNFKEAYEYSKKLKMKIVRMRRIGLQKEGIYSPENLAFKLLRNSGFIQKLSILKIEAYDKLMSLQLQEENNE